MSEKILMCGNEALAEAAIRSGLDAYFGYPITPQNEITAYMALRMPQEGRVFLQSESELAAINMVFGAAATGARVMTSSSSPGISLMQEGMSYLAGARLPAVVVNIMRGGPGLGNIAPSQSDYFQATRGGGHGDYRHIVLAPASVQELADSMPVAFELAEKYLMTVMILGDGFLGQMMEPVCFDDIKSPAAPEKNDWALTGADGRKQRIVRSLLLAEGALEQHNLDLQEQYEQMERKEMRFEQHQVEDAEIVLIAYGMMARIAGAAVRQARREGIKAGWFRPISLWPFPAEPIVQIAQNCPVLLTVEMSHGQMFEDVRLAVNGRTEVEFYGRAGGGVPSVEQVLEQIKSLMKTKKVSA